MAPSRAAFRARFRALPPSDATAYLADLYAAQGFSVEQHGGRLSVTRDGRTSTVALAGHGETSDADVVVTRGNRSDSSPGTESLDPDDLYERTRYAVDGVASTRLLETYFEGIDDVAPPAGRATDDSRPEGEADATPASATGQGSPSGFATWSRRGLLVAAGAALGGGVAAFGGSAPPNGESGTTTPDRQTPTPTPSVPVPGLSTAGVTDPAALADAHAAAANARSYTLTLSEFRHDDALELRSAFGLELSLSADRTYLAIVQTAGPEAPLVLGRPPARSVYWSDGEVYYVDHRPDAWGGVSTFRPLRGWVGTWRYWANVFAFGGTVTSAPADYFRSLLGGVAPRLVGPDGNGGSPRYRLEGRVAVPESDVDHLAGSDHRDLDLSAVVDRTGLVRAHDLSYRARFEGGNGRVRRTLEYTDVGETTVTRPVWAD